jgi:hypothetical protein
MKNRNVKRIRNLFVSDIKTIIESRDISSWVELSKA